MFLGIDIGNTHTVYGLFRGSKLLADWRVVSAIQRTEDEIGVQLRQFLREKGFPLTKVRRIGISSVVPNLTDVFAGMAKKYFDLEPVIVDARIDLDFKILYADPQAVGADRLCNAVAGFTKFGGPLIVIDFGTATTYDVIARNGDYLGGVIAPGVETSAMDLHRRAAKLPKIELHFPREIIGTDTVSSMQAGILFGALDGMEGMVKRLQAEIYKREQVFAKVIATGGFSTLMAKYSNVIEHVEPALVLEGIRLIVERVDKKKSKKK
jgi:type III pantothenate kinase